MAITKVKPNPKDLLKKAFAHKNQDGTNATRTTTAAIIEEKAKAVFDDLNGADNVHPKASAPEVLKADQEKTEEPKVAIPSKNEDANAVAETATPSAVETSLDDSLPVDQDIPDFLVDDMPPPDDDYFPPEEEFDPADLVEAEITTAEPESEPETVEPEPVVESPVETAEPVAEPLAASPVDEVAQSEVETTVSSGQEPDAPTVVEEEFVYIEEPLDGHLDAPQTDFLDVLIEQAQTEDIFDDAPEVDLTIGNKDFNDAPPDLPEPGFTVEVDEAHSLAEKNQETLSLLDQVKADKDARKREYKESLQKLEAIENERNELEEIMRQQLLKQQQEEAAKLNEGIEKIRSRNRNFLALLRDLYKREDDAIQADNLVAIAQTFKTDSTINLQSYLLINRYLHRFNIKYDMDEIRVLLNEDLLNIETPPLDFDYYYLWESNLDSKITPYMWDKHKLMVFKRANFTCELCGGVGAHNPVELYPQWRMFDSNRTQILQGFLALCPKCVDAKNHAQLKKRNLKLRYESAREHIKTVNGWDDRQVENALLEAEEIYAKRVDAKAEPERFKKWKLNIQVLENIFGVPVGEPQFHQRSHIKNDYQQIFEPHVAYLFGKIESDRMIKTGKTKFLSINLNVEPMKKAR